MVEDVFPRRSETMDPAVANLDHLLLVFSADLPPWDPGAATRFLVSSEAAGLPVTLVLNKADLLPPAELQEILAEVGYWMCCCVYG